MCGQADMVGCCPKHQQNRSVHIHRLQGKKQQEKSQCTANSEENCETEGAGGLLPSSHQGPGRMSSVPCSFTDMGLLSQTVPRQHHDSSDDTQRLQKSQCRSPVRNYCVCLRWFNRTSRTPQSRKTNKVEVAEASRFFFGWGIILFKKWCVCVCSHVCMNAVWKEARAVRLP